MLKRSIVAAIVAAMLIVFCSGPCISQTPVGTQPAGGDPTNGDVDWRVAAKANSARFFIQLTVERDDRRNQAGANYRSPLQTRHVHPANDIKDGDAFIKCLSEWLPEARFVNDPEVPGCTHIVERSLLDDPNYVMGRTLSIKFEGTLGGLLDELKKQSDGALAQSLWRTIPSPRIDYERPVKVNATNRTYREILSSAISPSEQSGSATTAATEPATEPAEQFGIRWEAFTFEDNGKIVTYVEYNIHPKTPAAKNAATPPVLEIR